MPIVRSQCERECVGKSSQLLRNRAMVWRATAPAADGCFTVLIWGLPLLPHVNHRLPEWLSAGSVGRHRGVCGSHNRRTWYSGACGSRTGLARHLQTQTLTVAAEQLYE